MQDKINKLKEEIAGEIVYSTDVSAMFKKWRNIFDLSQRKVAKEIGITSATLSDYEAGKRPNPGVNFIRKFVDALINLDLKHGGKIIKSLLKNEQEIPFYTKEFKKQIKINKLFDLLKLENVNHKQLKEYIFGFTVIDYYLILKLDINKYPLLFGKTNKRIFYITTTDNLELINYFLKVLRYVTNQQPLAIVFEKSENINYDEFKINLPLYVTELKKEEIIEKLKLF